MAKESSFTDSITLTFVGLAEALFPVNSNTASWEYPSDQLSEIYVSLPISTCLHTIVQSYWDNICHQEDSSTPPLALFARGVRLDKNATPESAKLNRSVFYSDRKIKVLVLREVSFAS